MPRPLWERFAPVAGLAFGVLFVASIVMAKIPGGGDSTQDVADWLNDSQGHRVLESVSVYLALSAGLCFIWFLAALTNRLRRAEGEPPGLSRAASLAGAVFVSLLFLYASSIAVLAFSRSIGEDKAISVETAHFGMIGGVAFLISGMFAAAGVMVSSGIAAMSTRVFPVWFGWLSLAGAVIVLFGIIFFPAVAFPIWVLVASFLLWQQSEGIPVRA